jgi:hypothetical protein
MGARQAAVGFRVKSGWASAVLVAGSVQSPQVIDRCVVELSDAAVPESRQPYHAAMGTLQTDETKVRRLGNLILRAAKQSVPTQIESFRKAGYAIAGAGVVVGSETDPAKITNPHIRAHALEGWLFRTALEEAVQACGVACLVLVERTVYQRAAEVLKRSEAELKRTLTRLGRSQVGPWRANEKAATLAAWLVLACQSLQR